MLQREALPNWLLSFAKFLEIRILVFELKNISLKVCFKRENNFVTLDNNA